MRDYYQHVNSPHDTARDQVLALGMSQHGATLVMPFMWFSPSTSDPDSPAILMLVAAIQQRLIERGHRIGVTGFLDAPTTRAMDRCCGQGWQYRPWVVVVGQVVASHNAVRGAETMYEYGRPGIGMGRVANYCSPSSRAERRVFEKLQKAINWAAIQVKTRTIKVDGVIGDRTMDAARAAAVKAGLGIMGLIDCQSLAANAASWTKKFNAVEGRPGAAPPPPRESMPGGGSQTEPITPPSGGLGINPVAAAAIVGAAVLLFKYTR